MRRPRSRPGGRSTQWWIRSGATGRGICNARVADAADALLQELVVALTPWVLAFKRRHPIPGPDVARIPSHTPRTIGVDSPIKVLRPACLLWGTAASKRFHKVFVAYPIFACADAYNRGIQL
jgi:hypothetical protein